jgi:hypothetical protein
MSRPLFLLTMAAMEALGATSLQKVVAGVLGATSLQKVVAAVHILAYGVSVDFLDDYVRMGEGTIIEVLQHVVMAVVEVFKEKYLRTPNANDIVVLMTMNNAREFWSNLVALTSCIGDERIAQRFGEGHTHSACGWTLMLMIHGASKAVK